MKHRMNKNLVRSLVVGAALSMAGAGAASAGVINFSLNSMNQAVTQNSSLGSKYAFAGGVTAYSGSVNPLSSTCTSTSPGPCLYYKYTNGNTSETGLGLSWLSNDEIGYGYGIGLKVSSGFLSGLDLGSVQSGESWQVLGCSSLTASGCLNVLASGIGPNSSNDMVTLTGLGHYMGYVVDVPCMGGTNKCNPAVIPGTSGAAGTGSTDYSNNILLTQVTTVSNVPEPGSLALFAAGLLGCLLFARRRMRQN